MKINSKFKSKRKLVSFSPNPFMDLRVFELSFENKRENYILIEEETKDLPDISKLFHTIFAKHDTYKRAEDYIFRNHSYKVFLKNENRAKR